MPLITSLLLLLPRLSFGNLSDFEAILLPPSSLSLSPPNVLFVGNWSEIYRSADLPGVADERLIGSNSS